MKKSNLLLKKRPGIVTSFEELLIKNRQSDDNFEQPPYPRDFSGTGWISKTKMLCPIFKERCHEGDCMFFDVDCSIVMYLMENTK